MTAEEWEETKGAEAAQKNAAIGSIVEFCEKQIDCLKKERNLTVPLDQSKVECLMIPGSDVKRIREEITQLLKEKGWVVKKLEIPDISKEGESVFLTVEWELELPSS